MASKRKNKKKNQAVRQQDEQVQSTTPESADVQDGQPPEAQAQEDTTAAAEVSAPEMEQADAPDAVVSEPEPENAAGQSEPEPEQASTPGETALQPEEGNAPLEDAPGEGKPEELEQAAPEPDASQAETVTDTAEAVPEPDTPKAETATGAAEAGQEADAPRAADQPAPQEEMVLPEAPQSASDEFDLPEEPEEMPFELPAVPKKMPGGAGEKKKRRKKKRKRRKRHVLFWLFMFLTLIVVGGSVSYIYWLFTEADSVIFDMKADVELPNFVGLRWEDVEKDAAYSGFKLQIEEVYHDEAPVGEIVDQNPRAPRDVKERSTITLKVSKGVETVVVPDLTGWNKETARERLRGMNLTLMIRPEENNDVPADSVIRTVPEAGALVKAGTTVTLYIRSESKELGYVSVPTCVGAESSQEASLRLTQRGLLMHATSQEDAAPAGTIISQSPEPGTMVMRGATVNVVISTGPPPEAPPPESESDSTPWWGGSLSSIGAGSTPSSSTETPALPPANVLPGLSTPSESNAGAQP